MNTIDYLNEKISELQIQLDNIKRFSAAQRIVCALKKMALNQGLNPSEFKMPISKGTMALRIGIEQETFSRAIPKMINHGVVMAGRTVLIDREKSINTVCDHCAGRRSCRAVTGTPTESGYPLAAAPR